MNRHHASAVDPQKLALIAVLRYLKGNSLDSTAETLSAEADIEDVDQYDHITSSTLMDALVAWNDKTQAFGDSARDVDEEKLLTARQADAIVSRKLAEFDALVNVTVTRFLPNNRQLMVATTDHRIRLLDCDGKENPRYVARLLFVPHNSFSV